MSEPTVCSRAGELAKFGSCTDVACDFEASKKDLDTMSQWTDVCRLPCCQYWTKEDATESTLMCNFGDNGDESNKARCQGAGRLNNNEWGPRFYKGPDGPSPGDPGSTLSQGLDAVCTSIGRGSIVGQISIATPLQDQDLEDVLQELQQPGLENNGNSTNTGNLSAQDLTPWRSSYVNSAATSNNAQSTWTVFPDNTDIIRPNKGSQPHEFLSALTGASGCFFTSTPHSAAIPGQLFRATGSPSRSTILTVNGQMTPPSPFTSPTGDFSKLGTLSYKMNCDVLGIARAEASSYWLGSIYNKENGYHRLATGERSLIGAPQANLTKGARWPLPTQCPGGNYSSEALSNTMTALVAQGTKGDLPGAYGEKPPTFLYVTQQSDGNVGNGVARCYTFEMSGVATKVAPQIVPEINRVYVMAADGTVFATTGIDSKATTDKYVTRYPAQHSLLNQVSKTTTDDHPPDTVAFYPIGGAQAADYTNLTNRGNKPPVGFQGVPEFLTSGQVKCGKIDYSAAVLQQSENETTTTTFLFAVDSSSNIWSVSVETGESIPGRPNLRRVLTSTKQPKYDMGWRKGRDINKNPFYAGLFGLYCSAEDQRATGKDGPGNMRVDANLYTVPDGGSGDPNQKCSSYTEACQDNPKCGSGMCPMHAPIPLILDTDGTAAFYASDALNVKNKMKIEWYDAAGNATIAKYDSRSIPGQSVCWNGYFDYDLGDIGDGKGQTYCLRDKEVGDDKLPCTISHQGPNGQVQWPVKLSEMTLRVPSPTAAEINTFKTVTGTSPALLYPCNSCGPNYCIDKSQNICSNQCGRTIWTGATNYGGPTTASQRPQYGTWLDPNWDNGVISNKNPNIASCGIRQVNGQTELCSKAYGDTTKLPRLSVWETPSTYQTETEWRVTEGDPLVLGDIKLANLYMPNVCKCEGFPPHYQVPVNVVWHIAGAPSNDWTNFVTPGLGYDNMPALVSYIIPQLNPLSAPATASVKSGVFDGSDWPTWTQQLYSGAKVEGRPRILPQEQYPLLFSENNKNTTGNTLFDLGSWEYGCVDIAGLDTPGETAVLRPTRVSYLGNPFSCASEACWHAISLRYLGSSECFSKTDGTNKYGLYLNSHGYVGSTPADNNFFVSNVGHGWGTLLNKKPGALLVTGYEENQAIRIVWKDPISGTPALPAPPPDAAAAGTTLYLVEFDDETKAINGLGCEPTFVTSSSNVDFGSGDAPRTWMYIWGLSQDGGTISLSYLPVSTEGVGNNLDTVVGANRFIPRTKTALPSWRENVGPEEKQAWGSVWSTGASPSGGTVNPVTASPNALNPWKQENAPYADYIYPTLGSILGRLTMKVFQDSSNNIYYPSNVVFRESQFLEAEGLSGGFYFVAYSEMDTGDGAAAVPRYRLLGYQWGTGDENPLNSYWGGAGELTMPELDRAHDTVVNLPGEPPAAGHANRPKLELINDCLFITIGTKYTTYDFSRVTAGKDKTTAVPIPGFPNAMTDLNTEGTAQNDPKNSTLQGTWYDLTG